MFEPNRKESMQSAVPLLGALQPGAEELQGPEEAGLPCTRSDKTAAAGTRRAGVSSSPSVLYRGDTSLLAARAILADPKLE